MERYRMTARKGQYKEVEFEATSRTEAIRIAMRISIHHVVADYAAAFINKESNTCMLRSVVGLGHRYSLRAL